MLPEPTFAPEGRPHPRSTAHSVYAGLSVSGVVDATTSRRFRSHFDAGSQGRRHDANGKANSSISVTVGNLEWLSNRGGRLHRRGIWALQGGTLRAKGYTVGMVGAFAQQVNGKPIKEGATSSVSLAELQ